jgi:hypothetical protein
MGVLYGAVSAGPVLWKRPGAIVGDPWHRAWSAIRRTVLYLAGLHGAAVLLR